ncbi:hypothetical protein KSP39_PZI016067 [Platanthera zijinensis]|uniref:Uncharacterized protein n=1 Tax=Platanthera zijinensis TaxID=2320716 RepID=A0AAP0B912_9ASPA
MTAGRRATSIRRSGDRAKRNPLSPHSASSAPNPLKLRFEAVMQPLLSSVSSKSFAMSPAAGRRRRFLPSVPPTLALFTALRFLRLRFRLLFLLCFPSGLYLLLHSSDSNSFLSHFLLVLVISSGAVLLLHRVLLFFRVLPLSATFPLLLSAIRALPSWIRADRRTGLAVKPHDNGDLYEGELRRGKCHGSGVCYYYRSGKYEGEWIDSKCDGHGVETWNKGSRYEGQFKKGLPHGFGVHRNHTGDLYAGEWLNGQSHGYGEHTSCLNGQGRYVGEFKWGLKNGLGLCHFRFDSCGRNRLTGENKSPQTEPKSIEESSHKSMRIINAAHFSYTTDCECAFLLIVSSQNISQCPFILPTDLIITDFGSTVTRNADTYAGEYFADKMHGFGVYHFADGRCYEGAWREGKREGLGMCSSANGESQYGRWANDVLEISTSPNPFPGASFAVNHTRVLNAVQDARATAERAYNVPRVDGGVKKAVAAAGNAANAAAIAGSKAVQTEKKDRGVEYLHDFPMQIV